MSVQKYKAKGKLYYRVVVWLGHGRDRKLFRRGKYESREDAVRAEAEVLTGETPQAVHQEGVRLSQNVQNVQIGPTVRAVWALYAPVGERDCRAWKTDTGRAKRIVGALGDLRAADLHAGHIDAYRATRFAQKTCRGGPPSPATLDRELEVLKRALNYSVKARQLTTNPLDQVGMLRKNNTRRMVLDEARFQRLHSAADPTLKPILLTAFDTGMRLREVLNLMWANVDLVGGRILLHSQDTKTQQARTIVMTDRLKAVLGATTAARRHGPVFPSPDTRKPFVDVRRAFKRACDGAGIAGLWFHDLRRSYITRARQAGVPESVVMRISGHRTRSVFDRYNVVDERDLRLAAQALSSTLMPSSATN